MGTPASKGFYLHFDAIKFVPKADYACSPAFRYLASSRIDDCDTTLKLLQAGLWTDLQKTGSHGRNSTRTVRTCLEKQSDGRSRAIPIPDL